MDSGGSGSMQSSSGGDEEYDSVSRPDHHHHHHQSVQSFLNSSSTNNFPSFLGHNQPTTFFDQTSNYLQALSQSQPNSSTANSLLNLDVVRPRGLRSDTDPFLGSSSSSSNQQQQQQAVASHGLSHQLRSVDDNNDSRALQQQPDHHQTNFVMKNPKKRTRASRRAPTTVLTTDTSNFRQMVQEFTGIPAPPFSGGLSYSRRLDLFSPSAAAAAAAAASRSSHLETLGPLYTLHTTKVQAQPTPFVSNSAASSSHSLLNNNATVVDATNIASVSTSISVATANVNAAFNSSTSSNNYNQLASDLGQLPKQQPHNVLNMQPNQNQILSFQSLLQPPPPPPPAFNPSFNVPAAGFSAAAKSQLSLNMLEELGVNQSHGHVNANLLQADGRQQQEHPLRAPFDGSNNSSCKLNFSSASSSDHFHLHEKGLENNVGSRGEGTVDAWICPSE